MAFLDLEKSLASSQPTELYLFTLGSTYWAQNSGTEELSWDGKIWYPKLIGRSSKNLTTNSLKSKMAIETSLTNEFVQLYLTATLDGIVSFTLYRGQGGDYVAYWRGFVEKVVFSPTGAAITCSPMTSRLKRTGLQRRFSRNCGIAVYSYRCRLVTGDYQVSGVVDAVSGNTVTSSTFGTKTDGYFVAGYIETEDYSRMIVAHTGNVVTLSTPIPSLAVGESFNAYRGCDHTLSTCTSLSNNLNFGGHPWLPHKNPFTGDAIA